jgi:hypothetical protein
MTTERADCTFVVKEGSDDRPYLAIEPTIAGLDIAFKLRAKARRRQHNDERRQGLDKWDDQRSARQG